MEYAPMLTDKQKKLLKGLAHHRKPIVMMGSNGLTQAVLAALEEALQKHELVKVKIAAGDRDERDRVIGDMIKATRTELVQRVGNMATVFRRNPQNPVVQLK
jgi:RNA-binding protein